MEFYVGVFVLMLRRPPSFTLFPYTTHFRSVCKLLMLVCILTKNVITSCSVTMMLFLHLEVKPLMTLTTDLYLSCALISGHLAMMLMQLTKRRKASLLLMFNRAINFLCGGSLY